MWSLSQIAEGDQKILEQKWECHFFLTWIFGVYENTQDIYLHEMLY